MLVFIVDDLNAMLYFLLHSNMADALQE